MKKAPSVLPALLCLIVAVLPVNLFAQDGSLDLTFDTDGIAVTPIGAASERANAIALQADGKIVAAGFTENGLIEEFAVIRYNTNGSLDLSFDTDGIVTTPIGASMAKANAVAIQADGKIVVAGFSAVGADNAFTLVRYNANGSLDASFDTDGIVTTVFGGSNAEATGVVIQTDGKIVVTGYCVTAGRGDFALTRYNTNGSLDPTFDTDGIVITPSGYSSVSVSLVLQPDGKIVVGGTYYNSIEHLFELARYNTNGSLDNSFGSGGSVATSFAPNAHTYLQSIALQPDGKIVAVGIYMGVQTTMALARYTTNGSLDPGFDTDGKLISSIVSGSESPSDAAIQADGKILVAGYAQNPWVSDFSLVRYNSNGSLDLGFDTDGFVLTPADFNGSFAFGIVIQPDGKIILAGYSNNSTNANFAVVRYNNTINGLNDFTSRATAITIYPNPFSSHAMLETKQFFNNATLTLHNSLGEVVREIKNISGQSIPVFRENLESGIYFIGVSENETTIYYGKIAITD